MQGGDWDVDCVDVADSQTKRQRADVRLLGLLSLFGLHLPSMGGLVESAVQDFLTRASAQRCFSAQMQH